MRKSEVEKKRGNWEEVQSIWNENSRHITTEKKIDLQAETTFIHGLLNEIE